MRSRSATVSGRSTIAGLAPADGIDAGGEVRIFESELIARLHIALGNDLAAGKTIELPVGHRLEKYAAETHRLELGAAKVGFERIELIDATMAVLHVGRRERGIMLEQTHLHRELPRCRIAVRHDDECETVGGEQTADLVENGDGINDVFEDVNQEHGIEAVGELERLEERANECRGAGQALACPVEEPLRGIDDRERRVMLLEQHREITVVAADLQGAAAP